MLEANASSRRKVIAFDSWTGGVPIIEPLVEAFARRGLELFLIHIGSWGHDTGRPREERMGRLLVRDISYYGSMTFKDILEQERPSGVLFFSMQAFAHRAFNRYCGLLGIPTLHAYHGIVLVQSTALKRINPLNVRRQLAMAFSRLGKNLRRIWPVYARSLWETRASIRDWLWFAYTVWRQVLGKAYTGVAAPDASTAACCVYTEADIDHAVERYGVPRQAVFAVGNPDLVSFGVSKGDLGACLAPAWAPSREVMYIDTALIEAGAVFDGARDFARHLVETRDALAGQGFKLIVKLHPAHFRTGVPELLKQDGVALCTGEDFLVRLKNCCACIAEPSSLAVVPALMGMPLFLARYGKLAEQEYGEVLTSYPRARQLSDLSACNTLLAAERNDCDPERTTHWIEKNSGPLPAEDMPRRVAEVTAALILESRVAKGQTHG
jgi:hypothetical protein